MTGEVPQSPENPEAAALRQDIERLFSPENCTVRDSSWRSHFFLASDTRRLLAPRVIPREAHEIAMEGYTIKNGALILALRRNQDIHEWLGKRTVTRDSVDCDLTDYDYSASYALVPHLPITPYWYQADMLASTIPYDDRFARIVRLCLEAADQ